MRATHGLIGPLFDSLREIAGAVGTDAATEVGEYPKFFFREAFESGSGRLQIKMEINMHEPSPPRPPIRLPHEVKSLWCSGSAEILTIQPAELVATVIAHCMGLAVGEGSESGGGESDLPCSRH